MNATLFEPAMDADSGWKVRLWCFRATPLKDEKRVKNNKGPALLINVE